MNIESMTQSYITAALWSDCVPMCSCGHTANGGLDHHSHCSVNEQGGLDRLSIEAEDTAYIRALCEQFVARAGDDLLKFAESRAFDPSEGDIWSHVGYDLRMTSAGHATGFWHRNLRGDAPVQYSGKAFHAIADRITALADRTPCPDFWQVDAYTARCDHIGLEARA